MVANTVKYSLKIGILHHQKDISKNLAYYIYTLNNFSLLPDYIILNIEGIFPIYYCACSSCSILFISYCTTISDVERLIGWFLGYLLIRFNHNIFILLAFLILPNPDITSKYFIPHF